MEWYRVEVIGESREIYSIQAESADDAMERWHEGTQEILEVTSAESVSAMLDEG